MGVDVGSREIRVISIKTTPTRGKVQHAGAVLMPDNVIDNGVIVDPGRFGGVLNQLVIDMGITQRRAVAAITGKHVVTRYLKMPLMPANEIEAALRWEAGKFTSVPEEDLITEYINFGSSGGQDKQLDILLVAVPKKYLYQYYEAFSLAGLELVVIDIVPLALGRLFRYTKTGNEPVALIDIGAGTTNVVVMDRKRLEFSLSLNIGGDFITNVIASELGVGVSSAEQMKLTKLEAPLIRNANDDNARVNHAAVEGIKKLLHEVGKALDYYKMQSQGKVVGEVFLTGGTAKMIGLTKYIENHLGLKVSLARPEFSLLQNEVSGSEKGLDPSWAVAAGLALREVK